MINIKNLTKLRDYVVANKDLVQSRFDMTGYAIGRYGFHPRPSEVVEPECGTTMCLAGHGPAAGVAPQVDNWGVYVRMSFTDSCDVGAFLFSPIWPDDVDHAIARLDFVIDYERAPRTWFYNNNKPEGWE